ncbi:MAG: aspartate/glutamate racemase family protein [Candidatus Kaistia colombiensis]|nr:MAG: aspartate/glutamate racemase family protein [Kaistia sp.]
MLGIGAIVPSSNIIVERVTAAMLRNADDVSAHFARFGYAGSAAQFENDYDWVAMLEAARLLADAQLDVICWNGSRGGSLGFASDRLLCERISAAHGIAATTSTLALDNLLRRAGIGRIGFVTPYVESLNARIAEVWGEAGYDVVTSVGAGLTDNFSYSTVTDDVLVGMARRAALALPEALVFYCTNMRAAELCRPLEEELGLPVLDAVSAGVWQSLAMIDRRGVLGPDWGRLLV